MREPLVGIYALMAEWRALMDPATDISVAQIKLAWWRDEMHRLAAGSPLHPITRHLAELPRAEAIAWVPLENSVEAAVAQVAGAPLERAAELESHADALYGVPLRAAAQFGSAHSDHSALRGCTAALAAAEYLARAIADYGREARAGRVPLPVDELLACAIDNDDLAATGPPPHLQAYLEQLRRRAANYFSVAAASLPPAERPELRHLLVLAALGIKHLNGHKNPSSADFQLADLYKAWNVARRAAAAR
jgi:15-cis-phytoene synthase